MCQRVTVLALLIILSVCLSVHGTGRSVDFYGSTKIRAESLLASFPGLFKESNNCRRMSENVCKICVKLGGVSNFYG